ncbi:FG-GAP-like repeat-containing protein [Streptomyces sp. NPDC091376]|uniref:FG-GAP-like repeat-containing protein n=1 Tax=Streptomyces sp. NPDC091376 TaxID=3365994 RepID=UPI00381AD489
MGAVLAGGLLPPGTAGAARAAEVVDTDEAVIPAYAPNRVRGGALAFAESGTSSDGAGAQGVFHTEEGYTGRVWTRYADGKTFPVKVPATGAITGTGSDALAHINLGRADLIDAPSGSVRSITAPAGQQISRVYGSTVVTYEQTTESDGSTGRRTHLLSLVPDGSVRDVLVGDGSLNWLFPMAADDGTIVFLGSVDGARRMILVDAATGAIRGTTPPLPAGYQRATLSSRHLAVYNLSSSTVLVSDVADAAAPFTSVQLDNGQSKPDDSLAVVGDWLVHQPPSGTKVQAVPIAGGEPVTLLSNVPGRLSTGPGGTVVAIGGTGRDDWAIRRIMADGDGKPVVSTVKRLPPVLGVIEGLAVSQGRLAFIDNGIGGLKQDYSRILGVGDGPVTYGERSRLSTNTYPVPNCAATDPACAVFRGVGEDRFARLVPDGDAERVIVDGPAQYDFAELNVPKGGEITDADSDYLIHTSSHTQSVFRIDSRTAVMQRTPVASALWDGRLWSASPEAGKVTVLDLASQKTVETVQTGAPCVPAELQNVGRWLYWSCGTAGTGASGIFDRTAKKSVTVPSGEALLGDGYVVTHDTGAGKLVLTDVHTGAATSLPIGDLPDTGVSQRHVRWSVDRFGGLVAHADTEQRIHLIRPGVPAGPLTLSGAASTDVRADSTNVRSLIDARLSKPASSWTLDIEDVVTGRTVRTLSGGEVRGRLVPEWDGRTTAGAVATNGAYHWTLTVVPADGQGPVAVREANVTLRGGTPPWRDFSGKDATGDLLTVDQDGSFTFHWGSTTGGLRRDGILWGLNAFVVPFSDLTGDGCNDVIARNSNGDLYSHELLCRFANSPQFEGSTLLGKGWNQFNVLTTPGDLTGDGRADMVARQATTGDMYLYANDGAGKLKARGRIGTNWKLYRTIFGAGDINGDGIGDVLAVDKANSLWRYDGTAAGTLKPRVLVFAGNWAVGRNVLVGAGDITGDGRPDLISRNAAGDLLRNNGTGTGGFRSTVKIATGWNRYKGIY